MPYAIRRSATRPQRLEVYNIETEEIVFTSLYRREVEQVATARNSQESQGAASGSAPQLNNRPIRWIEDHMGNAHFSAPVTSGGTSDHVMDALRYAMEPPTLHQNRYTLHSEGIRTSIRNVSTGTVLITILSSQATRLPRHVRLIVDHPDYYMFRGPRGGQYRLHRFSGVVNRLRPGERHSEPVSPTDPTEQTGYGYVNNVRYYTHQYPDGLVVRRYYYGEDYVETEDEDPTDEQWEQIRRLRRVSSGASLDGQEISLELYRQWRGNRLRDLDGADHTYHDTITDEVVRLTPLPPHDDLFRCEVIGNMEQDQPFPPNFREDVRRQFQNNENRGAYRRELAERAFFIHISGESNIQRLRRVADVQIRRDALHSTIIYTVPLHIFNSSAERFIIQGDGVYIEEDPLRVLDGPDSTEEHMMYLQTKKQSLENEIKRVIQEIADIEPEIEQEQEKENLSDRRLDL